jgi:hypothetical protein
VGVTRLAGREVPEGAANRLAAGLEEACTTAEEPKDRPQSFESLEVGSASLELLQV